MNGIEYLRETYLPYFYEHNKSQLTINDLITIINNY